LLYIAYEPPAGFIERTGEIAVLCISVTQLSDKKIRPVGRFCLFYPDEKQNAICLRVTPSDS
jgi:hypothetical protein